MHRTLGDRSSLPEYNALSQDKQCVKKKKCLEDSESTSKYSLPPGFPASYMKCVIMMKSEVGKGRWRRNDRSPLDERLMMMLST